MLTLLPNEGARHAQLLAETSHAAELQTLVPLGRDWLNNATNLDFSRQLPQELGQDAIAQNDGFFQASGLEVLADP